MHAQKLIGRITRSDTRSFVGALRIPEPDIPTFGTYCQAAAQGGTTQVIGIIHNIRVQDDPFTRQLAISETLSEEVLRDNRENRLVPIELEAAVAGFNQGASFRYTLPPQPPVTLTDIYPLPAEQVHAFTESFDFIPLLLTHSELPLEQILVAAITQAAQSRPAHLRVDFLIEAGRSCARWLGDDLPRLERLLMALGNQAREASPEGRDSA